MQFNQCGPYPQWNYGSFNSFIPPQQPCNPAPEIVGEGEVVSTVNMDGSIQFYFIPVMSYPCGFRIMTAPCANPLGAWLIKTIANPIAASLMNQRSLPIQRCPALQQIPSSFMPDVNAKPSYQMKFHNDGCTSTSDLHYFCPSLRACWWNPPVPPPSPEPPQCSTTCADVYQHSNVKPPPPECMCVDQQASVNQQATKNKQESENTCNAYPGLCIGTCNKKQKQNKTSSKSSSDSLRCLLNKVKRKTKKRNGNTKRDDPSKGTEVCCSRCECTQATKRKSEEKKPRETPITSSDSWIWCKRKKKKDEKAKSSDIPPSDKKKEEKNPDTCYCTSSKLCLGSCKIKKKKEDKGESAEIHPDNKDKNTETCSSSVGSIKSFLDKIKTSLSSLYCTPSSCKRQKQVSAKPAKSSKSNEIQTKKSAKSKSSTVSLKGILTNICSKCKKKKDSEEKQKTRNPSSVRMLYDSGSKSSERSITIEPSPSPSSTSLVQCGCVECVHCTCKQKASDCQCSKDEGVNERDADHCTCRISHNKGIAADCKCAKEVPEDETETCTCKKGNKKLFCDCGKDKPKIQTPSNCKCRDCKEGKSKKWLCECDRDETKVQIARDCKCPDNQRAFDCKCPSKVSNPCPCGCGRDKSKCEELCKNIMFIEKKQSTLKTLKLSQSANGDTRKRKYYICGCDEDGKDLTNCDEQCKFKNNLKEVDEKKRRYYVCGCDQAGKDETNCDEQCKYKNSLKGVIENKRLQDCKCIVCNDKENCKCSKNNGKKKLNKFKCGCDRDSDKKFCDLECKKECSLPLQQRAVKTKDMLIDDLEPEMPKNNETDKKKTDSRNCSSVKDFDKKACDKRCKLKCSITLREPLSEDDPEESVMVIEPSDSEFRVSQTVLLTSASSEYCSCFPGHCKYNGTPESTCSCDSEVE